MRVSPKEFVVLDLLASSHMYGLELVKKSDGRLKRGTVYVLLGRLEDKGLVTSELGERPDRPESKLRIYSLTGLGATARNAYAQLNDELGGLGAPA